MPTGQEGVIGISIYCQLPVASDSCALCVQLRPGVDIYDNVYGSGCQGCTQAVAARERNSKGTAYSRHNFYIPYIIFRFLTAAGAVK